MDALKQLEKELALAESEVWVYQARGDRTRSRIAHTQLNRLRRKVAERRAKVERIK